MVTVTHPDIAIVDHHCSFGAATDIPRPYKWHWMRNGVLIPGAQSACAYTTPPLPSDWFGSKFSVKVFGLDGEVETSEEVELRPPEPPKAVIEADVLSEGELT